MRRKALELLARTEDDLTNAEIFAREATDEYWFIELCLETLHRLPSEVEPILMQREYMLLSARNIINRAMEIVRKVDAAPLMNL